MIIGSAYDDGSGVRKFAVRLHELLINQGYKKHTTADKLLLWFRLTLLPTSDSVVSRWWRPWLRGIVAAISLSLRFIYRTCFWSCSVLLNQQSVAIWIEKLTSLHKASGHATIPSRTVAVNGSVPSFCEALKTLCSFKWARHIRII